MAGGISAATAAAGHNSAGILSELESIKGPAMVSVLGFLSYSCCCTSFTNMTARW
jgi:hypothetical protein